MIEHLLTINPSHINYPRYAPITIIIALQIACVFGLEMNIKLKGNTTTDDS